MIGRLGNLAEAALTKLDAFQLFLDPVDDAGFMRLALLHSGYQRFVDDLTASE